ncbi:MAG TPA: PKD domain-containing protein, partial [Vicinamibacterales bacterium]|nr:PKD domain-containing protein [Vicinamibacterales bacterium]
YSWNFGDGTSGSGITTTHQFRTVGNVVVTLTVTDARGAQSVQSKTVVVQQPTPPTIAIDVTPTSPSVGRDTFFSAARSTGASGRSIVSYQWSFGDGNSGTGATTTHRYSAPGTYTVTLRATDDVGATATQTTTITVALGGPAVSFTILPAQPRPNQPVTINITATPTSGTTVRSYTINWGDGQIETVTSPTQSHIYGGPGAYVISVTATDSLGHTTTVTQQVTVTNP